jgi:hypothetical protein
MNDDTKKDLEENNTNAEYVNLEELNQIDSKDGEPLDPIEQNQVTPEEEEENSKMQLREAISGDDKGDDALYDNE